MFEFLLELIAALVPNTKMGCFIAIVLVIGLIVIWGMLYGW